MSQRDQDYTGETWKTSHNTTPYTNEYVVWLEWERKRLMARIDQVKQDCAQYKQEREELVKIIKGINILQYPEDGIEILQTIVARIEEEKK